MTRKFRPALLTLSLCLAGLGAAPALADGWDRDWRGPHYGAPGAAVTPPPRVAYAPAVLPEPIVRRHLREQGFRHIDRLRFDGRHYVARADDRWGRRVLVVASAHTGYALHVRPLHW
jgi:hypothetical protein